MNIAEAKMAELNQALEANDGKVNDKETVKERKTLKSDHKTWSSIFFRQHDLHSEMSALIDYLRG
jgi:hypothetical protein